MRLRHPAFCVLPALLGVLTFIALFPLRAAADSSKPDAVSRKAAFYVIAQGDKDTLSLVTINVADELNKHFSHSYGTSGAEESSPNPLSPPSGDVWAIPEPSWDTSNLNAQCADPNAVGGVVITTAQGYATHFWLLWQTETTTFDVFADVVSCNRGATGGPQIVGIVGHLPGAGNSPWIVRRTQLSIPLLTIAAFGTALSRSSSSSKTTNLTLAAVAGSLFSSVEGKDFPGYSDPVRLRLASRHIGVDVVNSITWLCSHADAEGGMKDAVPGRELCSALRF